MLLNFVGSAKMENNFKCSLTVIDVYDIAQDIGREFESLIDAYGTDAITGIMPKVVTALEQMEILAMKNERENTTVEDLRATIQQLEMDKQERSEDRVKYEKVGTVYDWQDLSWKFILEGDSNKKLLCLECVWKIVFLLLYDTHE